MPRGRTHTTLTRAIECSTWNNDERGKPLRALAWTHGRRHQSRGREKLPGSLEEWNHPYRGPRVFFPGRGARNGNPPRAPACQSATGRHLALGNRILFFTGGAPVPTSRLLAYQVTAHVRKPRSPVPVCHRPKIAPAEHPSGSKVEARGTGARPVSPLSGIRPPSVSRALWCRCGVVVHPVTVRVPAAWVPVRRRRRRRLGSQHR